MKKVLVTLQRDIFTILELRARFGESDSEVIGTIMIRYLSEK